jgi:hypothetical protein
MRSKDLEVDSTREMLFDISKRQMKSLKVGWPMQEAHSMPEGGR